MKTKYKSPAYWRQYLQLELYSIASDKSAKELSHTLNISVDEAQSILNGEWDGKVSDLIRFSVLLRYTPLIKFEQIPNRE